MKVRVNDICLNVIEQGSGPLTLIFMHYFGGSALEWQVVMNRLSKRSRCLAVDLRGYGDSDGPGWFRSGMPPGRRSDHGVPAEVVDSSPNGYSVDDMADDIICLVQELGIGEFVLVGHSMSGKVALAVAAGTPNQNCPAGLRQLLLLSPSPPGPEPIPDAERQTLLDGYGIRSAAEQTLKNTTANDVSKAVQEQIIADDLRVAKPAWDAWLTLGSREDISIRMPAVEVPIHSLVGSDDQALPPDVQRRMVMPYLKDATLEIVEGAGHLLPWEVPDVVAAFITKKIAG